MKCFFFMEYSKHPAYIFLSHEIENVRIHVFICFFTNGFRLLMDFVVVFSIGYIRVGEEVVSDLCLGGRFRRIPRFLHHIELTCHGLVEVWQKK